MVLLPYHLYEFVPAAICKMLDKAKFYVIFSKSSEKMPTEYYWDSRFNKKIQIFLKALKRFSIFISNHSNYGDRLIIVARKISNLE